MSGNTVTDVDAVNPVESVTVSTISYRVLPSKSCPLVGIWSVPLVVFVNGPGPGWMCESWRKRSVQEKALAGSGPSSASVAEPENVIASPAWKRVPVAEVRMVGVGGVPTRMVRLLDTAVLVPSETVSRAMYWPGA